MYSLYLDKPTEFSCDVEVKNASLKNAFARMIVESDEGNFLFKGELKDGKCYVPIKKLKGILGENVGGSMQLEIVIDDTYFVPWKDKFLTEEHTSVKVQVNEQKENNKKPIVEVKVKTPEKRGKLSLPAKEIITICEKFGFSKNTIKTKHRTDFKQLIFEYFKQNEEFTKSKISILNEVLSHIK